MQLTIDLTKSKEKEEAQTTSLRELKKELIALTEQFESTQRKAKRLETENKDKSQQLENMTRDFNEVNLRLQTYQGNIEDFKKLNDEYRTLMVANENIVAQQAAEVKEILIKMEVSKTQLDRLRDENSAFKKQNEKLTDDLKEK